MNKRAQQTLKRVGPECLGFSARQLSRVISGFYDDALAETGFKISQFSLLNAVANEADTRPAELANVLAMDESTLNRMLRACVPVDGFGLNQVTTIDGVIKSP